MADEDLVSRIATVLGEDADAYRARVREDVETLRDELEAGVFDNPAATIGLEYEFYAVDVETSALRRIPRRLLDYDGFEKELGLHNVELTTNPQPLTAHGLRAKEAEVKARLETARGVVGPEGIRLVSDGMWTIPPRGQSAREYLTNSVERRVSVEGSERSITIASNMSDAARYHAMANTDQADAAGMRIDAPHVRLDDDTVMPESLLTSIQPHYQVPVAADLPTYFSYALRVAGPLLALGVNAPFFPPDCYDPSAPPEAILRDAWMDHRIDVFETMLNVPTAERGKVRFPRDVETAAEAIERIASDDTLVPMPVETKGRYDDLFAHFRMKHGTYWRWVRPVFDGPTRAAANARLEFRPLSSQPTVRDSMAFLAAFAGLMEALPRLDHPLAELEWRVAKENFYAAARDGLEAELVWINADGEKVRDNGALFDELLALAADGLTSRGLSDDEASRYLSPLRVRISRTLTPARWKHREVERRIADGAGLGEAIEDTQREYVDRQAKTLLSGSFADWIDG